MIVHVVVTSAFAGTERYVAMLASAQHALGEEVAVVGGEQGAMRRASPAGVPVLSADSVAAAVRAIRSFRRPEVVHTHLTAAELAAVAAFPRRGPLLVTTRHIAKRRGSTPFVRGLAPLVRARVDVQVAISRYVAARVDGTSKVVLSGVPDAAARTGTERVVLVAQRLEAEKDTATALAAWAASGLADADWRLEVAGDGAERAALEACAHDLGVAGSVRWLGWVDDLGPTMERAAILLAPTPGDALGLTVIEAMARALPVVAAGAGGHLETVGAVPGARLYAPGDVGGAVDHLARLAEDAVARGSYGAALREHQQAHLSVERFARAVLDAYRDA